MRILFLADIVGTPGRKAVADRLPSLREELDVDFCIANGENMADGVGITPKLADRLYRRGKSIDWREALRHTTGQALDPTAFIEELAGSPSVD